MTKNTIVCNLFAGPGSGKSTLMAGIFSELKWRHISCEQAPEFAKEKVWESTDPETLEQSVPPTLRCQPYVFGKQLFTIQRLIGKVDVVVTDSPLLLSIIYGKAEPEEFHQMVLHYHNRMRNINFFIDRIKPYDPNGRLQTEDGAREKDNEIIGLLDSKGIAYSRLPGVRYTVESIADILQASLR
jgi:hypothetical protein